MAILHYLGVAFLVIIIVVVVHVLIELFKPKK